MNEEEKKAIEYFNNIRATIEESSVLFNEGINIECKKEMGEKIKILLRGIQSLQSKLNNSIPKQVVIDKIEEIEIIKQITSKAKYTHLELLQFAINNLEELLEK